MPCSEVEVNALRRIGFDDGFVMKGNRRACDAMRQGPFYSPELPAPCYGDRAIRRIERDRHLRSRRGDRCSGIREAAFDNRLHHQSIAFEADHHVGERTRVASDERLERGLPRHRRWIDILHLEVVWLAAIVSMSGFFVSSRMRVLQLIASHCVFRPRFDTRTRYCRPLSISGFLIRRKSRAQVQPVERPEARLQTVTVRRHDDAILVCVQARQERGRSP